MARGARGRFITLEGGEGGGKSTQVELLRIRLKAAGIDAVATREPGGAPGAEAIRRLLVEGATGRWDAVSEALLHVAARRDHAIRTVLPALDSGRWVVSDRFSDSTLAYQGYGLGLDLKALADLHRLAIGDLAPDLTFVLDLPVDEGLRRARARGTTNRYERMDKDFHQRLRDGFLAIAKREPGRCVVLDATKAPELVAEDIAASVRSRLSVPV